MAMTSAVKDELARVELNKTCCRKAEVSALLRVPPVLTVPRLPFSYNIIEIT